ncbi:hypothetical protein [Oceanitalea stevensii]|uniref:LemA family protein n=1 Tax=Oceanitalea stevensii TaxID=2763072 RepID=A0ABR8YYS3_9MICO|nr:hypothetical protein [Oceanitalea stevensii]MBD8061226.1 hypothetical protein [Oceanitalea stevensii]
MTWEGWTLVVVLLVLVLGWVLWLLASRVDRLHRKVLRSRATLELQLAQRAAAAHELAMSGALDPVEAVLLADVAQRASAGAPGRVVPDGLEGEPDVEEPVGDVDRSLVESELSRTLRALLESHADTEPLGDNPLAVDPLHRLDAAWYRLELARRFHNAHVAEVRRMRANPVVRVLHLAGRAPMPHAFDMDDARPAR